jgi:hypothetical protein
MTIAVNLSAEQKQAILGYNTQQMQSVANAAQAGSVSSDQFVYFAAFDGTNNDRAYPERSDNRYRSNPDMLAKQVQSAKDANPALNLSVGYFPGVQQSQSDRCAQIQL